MGEQPDNVQKQERAVRPKKPIAQSLQDNAPWLPSQYEMADYFAVKALVAGVATEDQQKRVLRWIIEKSSALYEPAWRPGGEEGRRNTDYALGRQHVGRELVKLINSTPDQLRRENNG